jgi:ArsR family transcriptional regulator, arsenate/arsenite/antimonite-responsive transcriptional repressor
MDDAMLAFKALGDPVRLKILEFLMRPDAACCSQEDRVCACDLETPLGLSQPAVSHHMKILAQAELVASEKDGRWVYYRVNRPRFRALSQYLGHFAKGDAPAKNAARAVA